LGTEEHYLLHVSLLVFDVPVGWLLTINTQILVPILTNPRPILINMNLVHLVIELGIDPQIISAFVDLIGINVDPVVELVLVRQSWRQAGRVPLEKNAAKRRRLQKRGFALPLLRS
jgi:hypothetical protein